MYRKIYKFMPLLKSSSFVTSAQMLQCSSKKTARVECDLYVLPYIVTFHTGSNSVDPTSRPSAHATVSWRRWPTPLFHVPGTPMLDNGTANVWKIAGRYSVGFFFPSAAPPIAATGSYAQGSSADVSKYLLRHIIQRTRSQNRR